MEGLPPQFAHVIERCVESEPENRWQSASDVKRELEWAGKVISPAVAPPPSPTRLAWLVAAVATLALSALAFFHFREAPPPEPRNVRFQIPPPEKSSHVAISRICEYVKKYLYDATGRRCLDIEAHLDTIAP